jgi:hypothetical protein
LSTQLQLSANLIKRSTHIIILYYTVLFCIFGAAARRFHVFFQDENPDINSENVADTDRSDVNSSDGWDEGVAVSMKLNDSVVDSELFKA